MESPVTFLGHQREPFYAESNDVESIVKFVHLFLLYCFRDRATSMFLRREADAITMWYCVKGSWYEMVPAPAFVWPELLKTLEHYAVMRRPERGEGNPQLPSVGWLEYRFSGRDEVFNIAVLIDPRECSLSVRLEFIDRLDGDPEYEQNPAIDDILSVSFSLLSVSEDPGRYR